MVKLKSKHQSIQKDKGTQFRCDIIPVTYEIVWRRHTQRSKIKDPNKSHNDDGNDDEEERRIQNKTKPKEKNNNINGSVETKIPLRSIILDLYINLP